jgi:hypothetical protein
MNARPPSSSLAVFSRAAMGAVIVVGILLIGYSTPVETIFSRDAVAAETAPVYGNGPTGYFPDMFTIVEDAAEPAEPAPTF